MTTQRLEKLPKLTNITMIIMTRTTQLLSLPMFTPVWNLTFLRKSSESSCICKHATRRV